MAAPVAQVWWNSILLRTQKRRSVSEPQASGYSRIPTFNTAKFTGYQYGGRPLGLTFVKYTNAGSGDAMEGTEATGGLTQEEIM
jgi:hypothetical protein